jgi:hypothetical protein
MRLLNALVHCQPRFEHVDRAYKARAAKGRRKHCHEQRQDRRDGTAPQPPQLHTRGDERHEAERQAKVEQIGPTRHTVRAHAIP